jgi:hypothetical protein
LLGTQQLLPERRVTSLKKQHQLQPEGFAGIKCRSRCAPKRLHQHPLGQPLEFGPKTAEQFNARDGVGRS